jgi:hypothetical protein
VRLYSSETPAMRSHGIVGGNCATLMLENGPKSRSEYIKANTTDPLSSGYTRSRYDVVFLWSKSHDVARHNRGLKSPHIVYKRHFMGITMITP